MIDIKQGYKLTEVGIIPEDWEVKELGDICYPSKDRINPITNKQNYKCIELEHLSQGSGMLLGYTKSNELLSQKSLFEKGDVLFGKLRPYLRKYLLADFDGVCTTEIWVLKTEKNISNQYLFHLVQSEKIIEAANISTGTKMPRAEWKTVSETKIPLPTKTEQTAIATALSDADALISSLEKLIIKKRNIKQGAMQKLLQPKEGWEVKKLGEICDFSSGTAHENFIDDKGDFIVVNSKFISTDGEIKKYSKTLFCPAKCEDILIVLSDVPNGRAIAKCYFVKDEDKYTVNQRIGIIKPKNVHSKYLFFLINRHKDLLAFDDGAKQTNLRNQDILNLQLKIYISIEKQIEVAECLTDMDTEIQALETKLDKYKNIKLGMMQELLTGKIRLI